MAVCHYSRTFIILLYRNYINNFGKYPTCTNVNLLKIKKQSSKLQAHWKILFFLFRLLCDNFKIKSHTTLASSGKFTTIACICIYTHQWQHYWNQHTIRSHRLVESISVPNITILLYMDMLADDVESDKLPVGLVTVLLTARYNLLEQTVRRRYYISGVNKRIESKNVRGKLMKQSNYLGMISISRKK